MSRFGRHFVRIRELKDFERRLLRLLVDEPGALHPRDQALYRYALALAQVNLFETPEGNEVSLSDEVDGLRRWMIESIVPLVDEDRNADIESLRDLAPVLALRTDRTRTAILENHVNDFGPEHLDDELRHKKLVLVLGGGGGSGLVHLGTFAMLKELGVTPELIVGSSMGSILGLLRALDRSYDPVQTALALPKSMSYEAVFRPFSGYSRFGFPGAFHMNLLRVARQIFQELLGNPVIRFEELPIPLQVVTCGIRRGYEIDESEYAEAAPSDAGNLSPLDITRKLKLFFKAVRQLSKNPRFLTQVVFGKEEDTVNFPVIEAVGFSCAVPGLLHYDIYHDDPETIDPLTKVFDRHQLLRLCDGGVINNVPSKVAWDSVQGGHIDSRNSYIVASDPFAPVTRGRNLIWIPIQQIARPAVVANRPYSDFHKTFRSPPNPLQVIVNSYSKLKTIIQAAKDEWADDVEQLALALEPLPPYGTWDIN